MRSPRTLTTADYAIIGRAYMDGIVHPADRFARCIAEAKANYAIESRYDAADGDLHYTCGGITCDGMIDAERTQRRAIENAVRYLEGAKSA